MHKWMDSGKNELTDLEVDSEMELEDDWRVEQEHIIGGYQSKNRRWRISKWSDSNLGECTFARQTPITSKFKLDRIGAANPRSPTPTLRTFTKY